MREHAGEIQRTYGYHDFHEAREYLSLLRWLYARACLSVEAPSVLFDLTAARLIDGISAKESAPFCLYLGWTPGA